MLRVAVFVSLCVALAAATTASTTLSCQSITITPASGSICKSASGSICATSASAALIQTTVTATWSALTETVVKATGMAACTVIGGTAVDSFWTNPTTWGCDGTNPDPCDSATCGTTATVPITTTLPFCCSSIRDRINSACSGVTDLTNLIQPGNCSITAQAILSAVGGACPCADTNCRPLTGAASVASASIVALLLAALLALLNF